MQIIRVALEVGIHISSEQWSALLYGHQKHKSDMQSIIDEVRGSVEEPLYVSGMGGSVWLSEVATCVGCVLGQLLSYFGIT